MADDLFEKFNLITEADAAILQAARDVVPVLSGGFRDSLRTENDGGSKVELFGDVVGAYLINGTSAHPIDPVNASVLHWVRDGASRYANHVDHPGTKRNDFREQIVQTVTPMLHSMGVQAVQASISNIKRRFGQ